jgi:hypothetical protein
MHVHHKYAFKLRTKCTVHCDILMFRDTAKFITDKINVNTINKSKVKVRSKGIPRQAEVALGPGSSRLSALEGW